MTEPTPGPWFWPADNHGLRDANGVTLTDYRNRPDTEVIANKRLACAAPKLLAAAKQALTHSDKETLFGRCGFCLGWIVPAQEDRGCDEDCAGRMLREAVEEAER